MSKAALPSKRDPYLRTAATPRQVQEFFARPGPARPRIKPYGNGFQLDWKAQCYGAELPYERSNGSVGYLPGGWTALRVVGRTVRSCVGKALKRERVEKLGLNAEPEAEEAY